MGRCYGDWIDGDRLACMGQWAKQQATRRVEAAAVYEWTDSVAWNVSDLGKNAALRGLRGCQGVPRAGLVEQGCLARSTALPTHGPVTKNPLRLALQNLPATVVQQGCAPRRPVCLADSGDSATRRCP